MSLKTIVYPVKQSKECESQFQRENISRVSTNHDNRNSKFDTEKYPESLDEVKNFFSEINTINLIIEKRKKDLENRINDAQNQLRFIDELRTSPRWIHSYLEKKEWS